MKRSRIKIGHYTIGSGGPPFIIAEMSANHGGLFTRAQKIIRSAAKFGAHALKLQTFTAAMLTVQSKRKEFQIRDKDSLWNGYHLLDLYQEAETPIGWHKPLFQLAEKNGLVCFSSVFDEEGVDYLEGLNPPCYKISSFEVNHLPLIRKVASTKKPLLLSTGAATLQEISEAVEVARENGCRNLILMKCTSSYPASPLDSNILTIPDMKKRFRCEVGLSDHTLGMGAATAAIAHGASVIEKHLTLSRRIPTLDSGFSMEPQELQNLAKTTQDVWQSLGQVSYGPLKSERASLKERRSLYVTEKLKPGDTFTKENLRCIRPGLGLAPKYLDVLLGQKVSTRINKGTPMRWEFVDGA